MGKKPKQTQTDYTRSGKAISDTAAPLYQSNLQRIDNYLQNPQAAMNKYLSDYYENNTATSDFLRNYNRAMSGQTGLNYAATTGGYTSTGQRAYEDQQRYQNDLAARLRDKGVSSAYNMASGDYKNMLAANNDYHNAYGLGKPYSDIEQYNYLAKQHNSFGNQLANIGGGLMSSAGNVLSAIPTAYTQAIGRGLQTAGYITSGLALDGSGSQTAGAAQRGAGDGIQGDIYGGANAANVLYQTYVNNPNFMKGIFGRVNH